MAVNYTSCLRPVPLKTLKRISLRREESFLSSKLSNLNFQNACFSTSNETRFPDAFVLPDFHGSVWGNHFISTCPAVDYKPDAGVEERSKELKNELISMFAVARDESDLRPLIIIINNIKRLGVAHHFESEIESGLEMIYNDTNHYHYELHHVALRFRLLRQAGYYISPDVFHKFKNGKGEFEAVLVNEDVNGMLNLYEAAYLGLPEEDVLDQAIAFTMHHLKLMVTKLPHHPLVRLVQHALELPLQKRIPRLEARDYISLYEEDCSRCKPLLEFAKLDFNVVQLLHRSELDQVSRWWRDIDIVRKQPFCSRDRLVESYIMMMSSFCEPQYTYGRIFTSKLFAILVAFDDLYDVYGKIDELQLLTDTALRWDAGALDDLPEYMKALLLEFYTLLNEVNDEMIRRGTPFGISYLQNQMDYYFKHVLEEAKLFKTRHVPSLEEWFRISKVTVAIYILNVAMILDAPQHISEEVLDWANDWPNIATISIWIIRLIDDCTTFKLEQKRGNLASCVTCYMKAQGVSEEEAIERLRETVNKKWKEFNKECMRPTSVPLPLLMFTIDMARVMEVFYNGQDGLTESTTLTKEIITSLLINPIPV